MSENGTTGLTKNSGWQMGVRKTVQSDFDTVWGLLFSDKGLTIWLGNIEVGDLEIGKEISLANGIRCTITKFEPFSHIRLKWKKAEWENTSRLQLRVLRSGKNAVISFAQEMLLNKVQREAMILHWKKVTRELVEFIVESNI